MNKQNLWSFIKLNDFKEQNSHQPDTRIIQYIDLARAKSEAAINSNL